MLFASVIIFNVGPGVLVMNVNHVNSTRRYSAGQNWRAGRQ